MSTKTHGSLQGAIVANIAEARQRVVLDASADQIIALALKRELLSVEVDGVGRVYYYSPQSVAERDAYHKHVRYDGEAARISLEGMIDGIVARVRNKDGKPLFDSSQRDLLMRLSNPVIQSIWNALGNEVAVSEEDAAKK